MPVRTKPDELRARWRRAARGRRGAQHPGAVPEKPPVPREQRHGGPSQDRALYTCECGYAFEALVTTSVDCPHCDRKQAW